MTVKVALPASMDGDRSCLVMMPSISTSVEPLTVTAMITRWRGSKKPEAWSVARGEVLPQVNLSWNPPWLPTLVVTCTETRASMTAWGTGLAEKPPIIKVR